ncbi:MAG TPA: zf-HC2 domain-containing protein [Pyrinomonadaceae bacterium]|nr:zf-HC2 domain-containing protein [Pyrinomonadaceae bacterium]
MKNISERPVCHRAEDLVTYLYGEASDAEARDFASHLKQCDACRVEFTLFHQVHDSIITWRNEALGSAPVAVPSPAPRNLAHPVPFMPHERRLSAWASLREFFSVSPLWLRGATAFAGLLLCALLVFAVSRFWQKPTEVAKTNSEPAFSQEKFDQAVQKQVDEKLAEINRQKAEAATATASASNPNEQRRIAQAGVNRGKSKRANGLNQEEREQLAADLGLIPGRDEELPFVLPEEPYQ